jgi:sRNA-binding protein
MTYKFSPEEKNEIIRKLAEQYPKAFFDNPKLRVPLMKNVVTALQRDGFPAASELISESVNWYQSHIGYDYQLQAGRKRIDLNGRESGVVTELEERAARKKISDYNEKKLAERHVFDSVKTTSALAASGRIANDQLRKIDAPPAKIEAPNMSKTASKPPICPELAPVYEALLAASAAMPTLAGNVDMQIALLNVVGTKLESIIHDLSAGKN